MSEHLLRTRVYRILRPYREDKTGEWASRLFDNLLIVLILANALAMMMETVASVHENYHKQLYVFEVISVVIFTVEYILRVWSCVEAPGRDKGDPHWKRRLRYVFSPMALIDFCAIAPFFLSMFFAVDLRVLRLFRLTRLIKLGRYSRSMQTLIAVFRNEAKTLLAALSVLLIIMVFAATGIYYLERHVQPDEFSSIPASLWWALVTLTTVGYGDVVPVTAMGKVFGGIITLLGVGLYALPAGILSSSFTAQMQMRRDRFREQVQVAILDGKLTDHEVAHLEKIRELLDLDPEEAELMIKLLQHHNNGRTRE